MTWLHFAEAMAFKKKNVDEFSHWNSGDFP